MVGSSASKFVNCLVGSCFSVAESPTGYSQLSRLPRGNVPGAPTLRLRNRQRQEFCRIARLMSQPGRSNKHGTSAWHKRIDMILWHAYGCHRAMKNAIFALAVMLVTSRQYSSGYDLSVSALAGGNLQIVTSNLTYSPQYGYKCVLQSSCDCLIWRAVCTNAIPRNGMVTNIVPGTNSICFYRAWENFPLVWVSRAPTRP